jgi:pyrroloquinoline quinone (PQQ) biosynthesis protein C
MWRVIIQCSAESWRNSATAFKAIAAKYPATLLSSIMMRADERRIMEYQLENVNDTEEFVEECMTLDGFTAMFESL